LEQTALPMANSTVAGAGLIQVQAAINLALNITAAATAPHNHSNDLSRLSHANDLGHSGTASGFNNFIDIPNFAASFSDLSRAFGTNFQAAQGWYNTQEATEKRVASFDGLDYVASYGDLTNAFASAGSLTAVQDAGAAHFITNGLNEGRTTTFNGL